MTSLVSGLERSGYVERHTDPSDGRAALVTLTDTGIRTLREQRRAGTASVAELLDRLEESEAVGLLALLPLLDRLHELDQVERQPGD